MPVVTSVSSCSPVHQGRGIIIPDRAPQLLSPLGLFYTFAPVDTPPPCPLLPWPWKVARTRWGPLSSPPVRFCVRGLLLGAAPARPPRRPLRLRKASGLHLRDRCHPHGLRPDRPPRLAGTPLFRGFSPSLGSHTLQVAVCPKWQ